MKSGRRKEPEYKLATKTYGSTVIDWNNQEEYLLAVTCDKNCIIYDHNSK